MLGDEFLQSDRNARQARRHGIAWGNFYRAADYAHQMIIREQVDYAVSRVFRAAVDAQDAHGRSLAGELLGFSNQFSALRLPVQQHLCLLDLTSSVSS